MIKRFLLRVVLVVAVLSVSQQLQGSGVVEAALGRSISFAFDFVGFNSYSGGSLLGSASVSGRINDDQTELSRLVGKLSFPLKDYNLEVDPSGSLESTTSGPFSDGWAEFNSECSCLIFHTYTWMYSNSAVPVNVQSQALKGSGTLYWETRTCVSGTCPPPGWLNPGMSQLAADVASTHEAGNLIMVGSPPTLQ